ncbi:MAG: GIY-YIG nuclease family protein [Sphingobacteriaceae bacterium]|nr:GIY-YIG nuclease family protein [Sphingobacteriaceae bacterium]
MFFVYILYSKKLNKYYTGQTDNLHTRLLSHKKGISTYTSSSDDWQLVYSESFHTRAEAIKRESQIKRKKSKKYIEFLIQSS